MLRDIFAIPSGQMWRAEKMEDRRQDLLSVSKSMLGLSCMTHLLSGDYIQGQHLKQWRPVAEETM